MKLLSVVHSRPRTRVSLLPGEATWAAAVYAHREPHLCYLLPTGGQQTAEDEESEVWCRTLATLSSGVEGMPSYNVCSKVADTEIHEKFCANGKYFVV